MTRGFIVLIAAAAAFVPLVLVLDDAGLERQLALGVVTALALYGCVRRFDIPTAQIGWAVVVATTGELILSVGAGLYDYAHAELPLYVPPGHGLFYLFAIVTARQPVFLRHERAITRGTVIVGSVAALAALIVLNDQLGALWWGIAALLVLRSRHGLVLSSCIAYTTALELLGTSLGNWRWSSVVPLLGIEAANPPAGVGILYITLDVVVLALTAATSAWRPAFSERSTRPADPYPL